MFNNEQQYYGQNYQSRQEHLPPRVSEWTSYNNPLLPPYSPQVAQPPYFPQHQYQNYTGLQSTGPLPSNHMPHLLNSNHPPSTSSSSLARTNLCYGAPPWHATTPYSRNTRKYQTNCHPSCRSTCQYQKSPTLANEPEATNRAPPSWYHPPSYWPSSGLTQPPRHPMPITTNPPWQPIPSATIPSSSGSSASSSSLSVAPAPTRFSNEIKQSQARISRTLNHTSPTSSELFSGYPSSFRPYVDSSRHIHKPTHESTLPIHTSIEAQNHPLINIPINPPSHSTTTSNINNCAPPRLDLRQYLSTWDDADESIMTPSPALSHRESANMNNTNQNTEPNISLLTSEQPRENTQQLLLVGTTENDLIECLLQKPETITTLDSKTGAILDLSMANKLSRFETSQTQGSSAAASILMEEPSNKELDFDFDCSFLQQSVNSSKKQINDIETTRDMPRLESPIIDQQTHIQRIINKSIPHIFEKSDTEKTKKSELLLTQSSRPQSAPPNSMTLELSTTPDNIPPSLSDLSETNESSDKIVKNSLSQPKTQDNTVDLTESQSSPLNEISSKSEESKTKNDLESEERNERQSDDMPSTHLAVNSDMSWLPRLQSVIQRVNTFSQPSEEMNSSLNKELYLSDKTKTPEEKLSSPQSDLLSKSLEEKNEKLSEDPNLVKRDIVVPCQSDKDSDDRIQESTDQICPKSYELEKRILYPHFSVVNKNPKDLELSSKKENSHYFSINNFDKADSTRCIQNTAHELKSPVNGIVFDSNKSNLNSEYITNHNKENVENDSNRYQENMLVDENSEESDSDSMSCDSRCSSCSSCSGHSNCDYPNITKNNPIQKNDSQENQCISRNYFSIDSKKFKENNKNDDYLNTFVHNTILSPINSNQDLQEEIPRDYSIDEIVKEKDQNHFKIANLFSENNTSNNREEIQSTSFDERINLPGLDTPQSIISSPEGGLHILEEENIVLNQDSSIDLSEKSNHSEKITNKQDNQVITSFNQNNTNAIDDLNLQGDHSFRENELNTNIREPNKSKNEQIILVTNSTVVKSFDRDENSSPRVGESSSSISSNDQSISHPKSCQKKSLIKPLFPPSFFNDPNILQNYRDCYKNLSNEELIESEEPNGHDSSTSLMPEQSEFSLFICQGKIPLSMLDGNAGPDNDRVPKFNLVHENSFLPFPDDADQSSEESNSSNDEENITEESRILENHIENANRSNDEESGPIFEVKSEQLRAKSLNSMVLYECISQTRSLTFSNYIPQNEVLRQKQELNFKVLHPSDPFFRTKNPRQINIKSCTENSKKQNVNQKQIEKPLSSKSRDKYKNNEKINSINTVNKTCTEESTSINPKNNNGVIRKLKDNPINKESTVLDFVAQSDINKKQDLNLNIPTTNENATTSLEINNHLSLTNDPSCSNANINNEITIKTIENSSKETSKQSLPSLPRVVIRRDIAGYTSHLKPTKKKFQPYVLLQRSRILDILAKNIGNDEKTCSILLRKILIDESETVNRIFNENETSHNSDLSEETPNLSQHNSDNLPLLNANTYINNDCTSIANTKINNDCSSSANTNINNDSTSVKELDPSPSTSKDTTPNITFPSQLKVSIPLKFKTSKSFDIQNKKEENWVMAEDINKDDMTRKKHPLSLKIVRENSLGKSKKNIITLKTTKREHPEIETKVNYHNHKEKILKKFSKSKKRNVLIKASQSTSTSPLEMRTASPTESERSHLTKRDGQQVDLTEPKENTKTGSTELSSTSLNHQVASSSKMTRNIINHNDLSKSTESKKKFKKKSPKKLKLRNDYYSSSYSSDEMPQEFNSELNKLSCAECSIDFRDKETLSQHMKAHHDSPTPRAKHHCCLCERSFDSQSRYAKHASGRWHQLIERSQQRAIDAVCSVLTGQPCPGLDTNLPSTSQAATTSHCWYRPEPGRVDHFHKATPLDKALQNLMKLQKDQENPQSAACIAKNDEAGSSNIVP